MPHDRFFSHVPLNKGGSIPLNPTEARHLKVMRHKAGDTVELVDGQGNLATATVIDSEHLQITQVAHQKKPLPEIHLAVALPHPSLLDWMVEKVTELGVDSLLFFPGKLSEFKTLKPNQIERLNRILIAATKQCGRLYLPTLTLSPPLKNWAKPTMNAYFGSLDPKDGYLVDNQQTSKSTLFFVGPEKGFHAEEYALFQKWGIEGKQLNSNILRAETAAVAAAAILLTRPSGKSID
jgi:16S rRNA (uracil1498-N3)-methyltransferase